MIRKYTRSPVFLRKRSTLHTSERRPANAGDRIKPHPLARGGAVCTELRLAAMSSTAAAGRRSRRAAARAFFPECALAFDSRRCCVLYHAASAFLPHQRQRSQPPVGGRACPAGFHCCHLTTQCRNTIPHQRKLVHLYFWPRGVHSVK